jgi:hypothetical protein
MCQKRLGRGLQTSSDFSLEYKLAYGAATINPAVRSFRVGDSVPWVRLSNVLDSLDERNELLEVRALGKSRIDLCSGLEHSLQTT